MSPAPPFACTYSPQLPELLYDLECTIAITTYQAGKVIFLSAVDRHAVIQLPRTFQRAMGLAVEQERLAVATRDEVIVFHNSPELAKTYPRQPGQYDALYIPRLTYYTGQVDMHDLHWGGDKLWAVNTSFSCLVTLSDKYSWVPEWKPHFIDELVSEDRCHLNGMAMQAGRPRYVTALGTGNSLQAWRKTILNGGVLMDAETDGIILHNLPMPHSPLIYKDKLYCLLSATGEFIQVDTNERTYQVLKKVDGFIRGLSIHQDYVFIGISKLRQNSSTFKDLEITGSAQEAGLVIMHLPTCAIVAELKYRSSVDEIYDVTVLSNKRRPGILNTTSDTHRFALAIPGATFWADLNLSK